MCKNSLTVYEKLRASKANMQKHLLYEQGRNLAEKKTHTTLFKHFKLKRINLCFAYEYLTSKIIFKKKITCDLIGTLL